MLKIWIRKLSFSNFLSDFPVYMEKYPGLAEIKSAAQLINGFIHRTPVLKSSCINKIMGANIWFKCENFQKAGSFKFRGASFNILSLSNEEKKKGVCTHSSGNHAQALALAAKNMGIKAYIVMPENSSSVKIAAVRSYGGEITFCKPTLEAREQMLNIIMEETGAKEIHPYNDLKTITGQATAAMELIEEIPELDMIMAPVGGGGLLSGTALVTRYLSQKTKTVAAEPKNADDAYRSFYAQKFIPSVNPNTIADGLLTSLGSLTFPIIQEHVDQIITTSEESIVKAMHLIWERMKIIIEPSSAVPLASLMEIMEHNDNILDFKGKKIGIILSGGNLDLNKIPWI